MKKSATCDFGHIHSGSKLIQSLITWSILAMEMTKNEQHLISKKDNFKKEARYA